MNSKYNGYSFPLRDMVKREKVRFHNRYGIELAGDLYLPKAFSGKLSAVAVSGPFGAVKEQCSGLYAEELASRGFAALAREELPRHPDLLPQLLGPAPAAIARVNRKYSVNVSFRGQNRPESRALTGRLLAAAERLPACRGVTVTADINPNDL